MQKVEYHKVMSRAVSRPKLTSPPHIAAYVVIGAVGLPMLWMAFAQRDPNRWAILGLLFTIVALFILHSRRAFSGGPWLTHLYLTVQTILIAVLTFLSPNVFDAVILLFMLSAEAAGNFPWRTALAWVSIFTLLTAGLLFTVGSLEALAFAPIYGGGYFFFAAFADQTRRAEQARRESQRLLEELQEAHRQLQAYAAQAEELAVAQERNRLAREMHDTLGHRLTVAAVQLEGAERLIPRDPERAAQMIGTVREQVRTALGELRQTVAALRTPPEAELPLPRALTHLADDFEHATGITVHRSLPETVPALPPAIHVTLYRAAQEALTNVQRHAEARQVWLTLNLGEGAVTLEVRDDGRGLPPDAEQRGFGLRGLRERANQLGGELRLESGPGGGTQLSLRLLLTETEHAVRTASETNRARSGDLRPSREP